MTLGEKLKSLRSKKGLTQKGLAERLNVSFQTVSKWENNENEPDLSTIRQLANLFGCSTDYLLSDSEEEPAALQETPEQPAPAAQPQTIIIQQHPLHVCTRCKKDIPEGELEIEKVPHHHRVGRHTETTYSDDYYHRSCLELTKKERAEAERKAKAAMAETAKKRSFGWGISMGVIALAIALIVLLTVGSQVLHPAVAVVLSILIGYGIFADLYCIISGSYIGDVFLSVASWSIKFPGLIFTFDLGGFAWLIFMKILFAVLGFLFGIFVLLLAIGISAALAMISFPFVLVHNNHNQYADAL